MLSIIPELQRPGGVGRPGGGSEEGVPEGDGGRPRERGPGWWGEKLSVGQWRIIAFSVSLLHGFIREIFERQKPSVSQLLQSACLRGFPLLGKDTEGNSPIGLIP